MVCTSVQQERDRYFAKGSFENQLSRAVDKGGCFNNLGTDAWLLRCKLFYKGIRDGRSSCVRGSVGFSAVQHWMLELLLLCLGWIILLINRAFGALVNSGAFAAAWWTAIRFLLRTKLPDLSFAANGTL